MYACKVGPRSSEPLNPQIVVMTFLLEYFVKTIVTVVCSIRVVKLHKLMGFTYPNKSTYLNTFVIQKCLDN